MTHKITILLHIMSSLVESNIFLSHKEPNADLQLNHHATWPTVAPTLANVLG